MDKKKLKKLHTQYPYIEVIIIYIFGILIGMYVNLFTSDISSNQTNANWRWTDSSFFVVIVVLITLNIIYYIFFSTYSTNKALDKSANAENELKAAMVKETKKAIAKDIELDTKISYVEKTITSIRKLDAN